jgi:2'-5' RNA ligase
MGNELNETRQVYEALWTEAVAAFSQNAIEWDRHLPDKARDGRRGVTLVYKPAQPVRNSISAFLSELTVVAPGQYLYRPEEFHLTVLAIIPGSEFWRQKIRRLPALKTIIAEVVNRHRTFSIAFRGVTASRGAVMIQGFPAGDALKQLRDDLRAALRQNGFGAELDVRYKIKSAHITVLRFCHPQFNPNHVLSLLETNRDTVFGQAEVESLELLFGDWYASAATARTLQKFPLAADLPG